MRRIAAAFFKSRSALVSHKCIWCRRYGMRSHLCLQWSCPASTNMLELEALYALAYSRSLAAHSCNVGVAGSTCGRTGSNAERVVALCCMRVHASRLMLACVQAGVCAAQDGEEKRQDRRLNQGSKSRLRLQTGQVLLVTE